MNVSVGFDYKKLIKQALAGAAKFKIVLTMTALLLLGGFVLLSINSLTTTELDKDYRDKQLQEIKVVEFDEESIEAIEGLSDTNVRINSDFTNRNNPFSE